MSEALLGREDLMPGTLEQPKRFGLLDTETNTWLGTADGPLTYDDHEIARLMRQIIAARIPCDPLRISVEPFTSATKKLDEIKPKNTLNQAMDLIEKRGY
jgi:hypothetical protein